MVTRFRTGFSSAIAVRLVAASLLVAVPSSGFALDGTLSNERTGADSANMNDVAVNRDLAVSLTNTANVTNSFNFTVNTGGNTVTNNTTVGNVTTGDATLELKAETTVNELPDSALQQALDQFAADGTASVTSSNAQTGAGSTNTNTTGITKRVRTNVTNTMNVTNNAALDINTGGNTVNDNTTVGDITTGNISVIAAFLTQGDGKGAGFPGNDTPGDTGTGGGTNPGTGPVTVAQLPPTVISQAPATTTQDVGRGGGQFFPAGTDSNLALELLVFVIAAILLVRFQELLPILFPRLQRVPVIRPAR